MPALRNGFPDEDPVTRQLDLWGQRLKEEGIARAAGHEPKWTETALADFVRFVRSRGVATMEAWRAEWMAREMPEPPSHKSWGAVANIAARKKLIVRVGYTPALSPKTHAHPVSIWRAAS